MDESRYWALIDAAWRASEWDKKVRRWVTPIDFIGEAADRMEAAFDSEFLPALRRLLRELSAGELRALDATQDRLVDALDNEDVYETLQGSDDGFLYRRYFVVGTGQHFYETMLANPLAAEDTWPEPEGGSLMNVFVRAYRERFGEWPG